MKKALLLLFLASPSWSTIAFINHKEATGANAATTAGIDTTTANFIVACIGADNSAVPALTDSGSGTVWNARTSYQEGGGTFRSATIEWATSFTGGASHTFTATSSGNAPSIAVAIFSGVATAPYDVENGGAQNNSTWTVGSVTPNFDNELLATCAQFGGQSNSMSSIDSGFSFNGITGVALGYLIETTATAKNPTWTLSSFWFGSASIATFKVAAAAVATPSATGTSIQGGATNVQGSEVSIQ